MTMMELTTTAATAPHTCPPPPHRYYEEQYDDPDAAMDYDPEADFTMGDQNGADPATAQAAQNGIVESGDPAAYGAASGEANKERITTPYMTKYERARILGTRALQIR